MLSIIVSSYKPTVKYEIVINLGIWSVVGLRSVAVLGKNIGGLAPHHLGGNNG